MERYAVSWSDVYAHANAGRRYFIDSDSPWFPVCEENLLPE